MQHNIQKNLLVTNLGINRKGWRYKTDTKNQTRYKKYKNKVLHFDNVSLIFVREE